MKIHEYQAKELLRKFEVPVPEGAVAGTAAQARQVAENLPGGPFVVKAQSTPAAAARAAASRPRLLPRRWSRWPARSWV